MQNELLNKKLNEMMQDDRFYANNQDLHLECFTKFLVRMYEKYAEKLDIDYN